MAAEQQPIDAEAAQLVEAVLERGQLAEAKRNGVGRKLLGRGELGMLWALRIYLLFMIAVVVYQLMEGARSVQ